jgi:hypothetical protein
VAQEVQPIDIDRVPTTLGLIEEVRKDNRPRLLKRGDEALAIVSPVEQPRRRVRKTGILTRDDPLFRMIGSSKSGIPGGISGRKYDFFQEAFGATE